MRKIAIILSVLAFIASGCKPATKQQAETAVVEQKVEEKTQPNTMTVTQGRETYILKEEPEESGDSYTPVSQKEIDAIAPVIKKWTDYYGVDFSQAKFVVSENRCLNCEPDKGSQFYWAFSEKDDADKLKGFDYSPNKQRYVRLIESYEKDGNYYWDTWQGVEVIYLVDRSKKHWNVVLYIDNLKGMPDAAFWKSNDTFIIVGCESYSPEKTSFQLFVYVFDIAGQTVTHYEITKEINCMFVPYLYEVTLKEKGLLTEIAN